MSSESESHGVSHRKITVAVHGAGTERQLDFREKFEVESPFHDAVSVLLNYLDTIYKSKSKGTREGFTVFVMVDGDNPFRVDFNVRYEPKKWRKMYEGMPQFNETGTEPYQLEWAIPEDVDAFPLTDPKSDSKNVMWIACPQHRRFGSYRGIKGTFENRVRSRLNKRLNFMEPPSSLFPAIDEPEWEPIDIAERIAKGVRDQEVASWLSDQEYKKGRDLSIKAATELVELMKRACPREISVLSTIYAMERAQSSCSDTAAKAREMLQECDEYSGGSAGRA